MGPRDGVDGAENLASPPGFDPRTVETVASRYTGPHSFSRTNVIIALLAGPLLQNL